MKSSSYILLLLLLLTNCSNEEMLQEYEKAIPIHFHSHYIEVSTKTNYTAFLVENSPISLFSIQHLENYTVTSWIPELFNNTEGTPTISQQAINWTSSPSTPSYHLPQPVPITTAPNTPPSPSKTTPPINTTSCTPLC